MISAGCASHPPALLPPQRLALTMRGEDTRIDLDFDAHPAMTIPFQLVGDELCYMEVGGSVIVCGQHGSYLLLGPEDASCS